MKLFACYTPSHRPLLEQHFMPSLPLGFPGLLHLRMAQGHPDFVIRQLPQRSHTGVYASDGFNATCLDKVNLIIDALRVEREPFLYSDVDVRFYGPVAGDLLSCLGDADMAFQWDGEKGRECTGFMVLRPARDVREFWEHVRMRMVEAPGENDQDACHVVKACLMRPWPAIAILPERYWTVGSAGDIWEPGAPIKPPADLLVHHANWTVGIENKLRLLEAVAEHQGVRVADEAGRPCHRPSAMPALALPAHPPPPNGAIMTSLVDERDDLGRRRVTGTFEVPQSGNRVFVHEVTPQSDASGQMRTCPGNEPTAFDRYVDERMKSVEFSIALAEARAEVDLVDHRVRHFIERHPGGATAAVHALLDQQRRELTSAHHPLPMAIVLQFWQGDKARALRLARLLADIEPRRRDDVAIIFARQECCPMDADIADAQLYVGCKFPACDLATDVDETKTYPGIAFDPWASAVQQMADACASGRLPYRSIFMCEADGAPTSIDWIDRLKEAHAATLDAGKRITGPRMHRRGCPPHINGTMVIEASCWEDNPSLHRCPPKEAWDCWHGRVLLREAGERQPILNAYGIGGLTPQVFETLALDYAWLASCKDDSALQLAEKMKGE